jgi:hypothetical protein
VLGRSRLAYKRPTIWAEARRNCQQEGASLAVVNSEKEADNLRNLYFNYGPLRASWEFFANDTTVSPPTTEEPPVNVTLHIGLHDIFIEGEYLTVRSKYVCLSPGKANLSLCPTRYVFCH